MRYSLLAGGKRLRPVFTLDFCKMCGGEFSDALPFAAAVEMIHTYSLIHDDLPCMDNDDFRRGKPSSHKKYGEANALLAGDALLTHAFYLLAHSDVKAENAIKAVAVLSSCAGVNGMIGGQFVDLRLEGVKSGINDLFLMDIYKTSALIKSACMLGCLAADASDEQLNAAEKFAENLGLAFQIVDDLLDVDDELSSDYIKEKSTYPSLLGTEKAKQLADEYTNNAIEALSVFGDAAEYLKEFSLQLVNRTK
jgi:geranylgeranyl diphosphate synthase type II